MSEGDGGNAILNVGVDLGTSRSSVSASNGERHVIRSYVGWPADMVARKVLQRDVLIGEDALENRIMLDLHRPLERGLIKEGSEKDAEAVRELLRHLIKLVNEDGAGVRAVVGVPAEALRVNRQQLRTAMSGPRSVVTTRPKAADWFRPSRKMSRARRKASGRSPSCRCTSRWR